jgi:hypothetical protein
MTNRNHICFLMLILFALASTGCASQSLERRTNSAVLLYVGLEDDEGKQVEKAQQVIETATLIKMVASGDLGSGNLRVTIENLVLSRITDPKKRAKIRVIVGVLLNEVEEYVDLQDPNPLIPTSQIQEIVIRMCNAAITAAQPFKTG